MPSPTHPKGNWIGKSVDEEDLFTNSKGELEFIDWDIIPMSRKHKIPKSEEREHKRLVHEQIWVSRDGSQTKISDMGPAHLRNTINMLEASQNNHPITNEYIRLMKREEQLRVQ